MRQHLLCKNKLMKRSKTILAACLLMSTLIAQAQIHKMERRDTVDHSYNLNPVSRCFSVHLFISLFFLHNAS